MQRHVGIHGWAVCVSLLLASEVAADPCGMVPPIYEGDDVPIARVGRQKTFVFFKDGTETFVIRPGFTGNVDEFGMLIPFPSVPAIRKVPDNIFAHVAAAVDPPEVVVDLRFFDVEMDLAMPMSSVAGLAGEDELAIHAVKVLKQEAVGMYEVAVLAAGSAQALQKWMSDHGYVYPKGMDEACNDYIKLDWCFVAVKTRVGQKAGVDPKAGSRAVEAKLPDGAVFDGNVQAMGFRFYVDELVVPMRLSAFNEGELHNVVYLLTDEPQRINSIPTGSVVRQISGEELYRNVTAPLPLRIIGGTYDDIPNWRKKTLPEERNPVPHNGLARELFASDLLAVREKRLSHPHEETEKMLLDVGERLGLRGPDIDRLNMDEIEAEREQIVSAALAGLKSMTLTVIDDDFPRDLLAEENLTFTSYEMDSTKNTAAAYDAKLFGPAPQTEGNRHVEEIRIIDTEHGGVTILQDPPKGAPTEGWSERITWTSWALFAAAGLFVLVAVVLLFTRRQERGS